jgi:hypothetical protein
LAANLLISIEKGGIKVSKSKAAYVEAENENCPLWFGKKKAHPEKIGEITDIVLGNLELWELSQETVETWNDIQDSR